ncbi:MAG TPA: hypothetical protein VHH73_06560 [Verrucomicrobiae bacterium]|nr:hypothetical protein [Verrucomicrobiae bacterium]
MISRTGKIARLPRAVRDQLNQRLDDGEQGPELLAWLNGLPEVREILARDFEGKEINAQNLSSWRQGGFQDWLTQGQVLELAQRLDEETSEIRREEMRSHHPLTQRLLTWLTARYLLASRRLDQLDDAEAWKRLRGLCADLGRLRRMEEEDRQRRKEEEGKEALVRAEMANLFFEMKAKDREARQAKEAATKTGANPSPKSAEPSVTAVPAKEMPMSPNQPVQGDSRCAAVPPIPPTPVTEVTLGTAVASPSGLAQSTSIPSENPAIPGNSR